MKYLSLFSGVGGFEKGIIQAYEKVSQRQSNYQGRDSADSAFRSGNERASGGNGAESSINHSEIANAVIRQIGRKEPLPHAQSEHESGRHRTACDCVGFSEIDRFATAIYRYHFPDHRNYGDASKIIPGELPDFDFLCAGFPCQSFSIAGKRQGFNDARGTMFFEIARVLSHKRPRHFLLENVRGLVSHDGGETFRRILGILAELGYFVEAVVLNSKDFGVPQNRERVFFIGHSGNECLGEILSFGNRNQETVPPRSERNLSGTISTKNQSGQCNFDGSTTLILGKGGNRKEQDYASCLTGGGHSGGNHSDMDLIQIGEGRQGERVYDSEGLAASLTAPSTGGTKNNFYAVGTLRTYKDGEGFREMQSDVSPALNARARQDGSQQPIAQAGAQIRRLTPIECERLQGFEDDWTKYGLFDGEVKEISDTQRYKTLGNAVTVNVIEAIVLEMLKRGCLC